MNYTTTSVDMAAPAELERECFPALASASPPVNLRPCAACKTLRRRCAEKCLLAPYFPPAEPLKFAVAHHVFGASNIIRLLQEIREDQREDAVNSMVYEAKARLRDPVYGCAGTISCLQNQIDELQVELFKAHAQILNMQCRDANLLDEFCTNTMPATQDVHENLPLDDQMQYQENSTFFF
ncbi:LOB domain-containing protein 1 [Perilla frutescens var. frutescens]|nr:LOB domain-containing protein 1 [Perilla frutescens var. frutescens]